MTDDRRTAIALALSQIVIDRKIDARPTSNNFNFDINLSPLQPQPKGRPGAILASSGNGSHAPTCAIALDGEGDDFPFHFPRFADSNTHSLSLSTFITDHRIEVGNGVNLAGDVVGLSLAKIAEPVENNGDLHNQAEHAISLESAQTATIGNQPMGPTEKRPEDCTIRSFSSNDDRHEVEGSRCEHTKEWKRLRSKRGYAYFVCYQCGSKWRLRNAPRHDPASVGSVNNDNQLVDGVAFSPPITTSSGPRQSLENDSIPSSSSIGCCSSSDLTPSTSNASDNPHSFFAFPCH